MKYVTKPRKVEAMQFRGLGPSVPDLIEFAGTRNDHSAAARKGDLLLNFVPHAYPTPKLWVDSKDEYVTILAGMWIVKDERGLHACTNDEFMSLYEPLK